MAIGDNKTYLDVTESATLVEDVWTETVKTVQPAEGEVWRVTGIFSKNYTSGGGGAANMTSNIYVYLTDGTTDILLTSDTDNGTTAIAQLDSGIFNYDETNTSNLYNSDFIVLDNTYYLKFVYRSLNTNASAGTQLSNTLVNAIEIK